jgi:hypothetical protein
MADYTGPDLEDHAFEDEDGTESHPTPDNEPKKHPVLTDEALITGGWGKLFLVFVVSLVVIGLFLAFVVWLVLTIHVTENYDWIHSWGMVSITLTLGAFDLVASWLYAIAGRLRLAAWLMSVLVVLAIAVVLIGLAVITRAPY